MSLLVKVFAIPALVFVITLAGLIGALVTDDWRDQISNIAVASGLLVTGFVLFTRSVNYRKDSNTLTEGESGQPVGDSSLRSE